MNPDIIKHLADYFSSRTDVAFVYLFGSSVRGQATSESDIDIAVYFYPPIKNLEWEAETEYPDEHFIWTDVERIVKRKVDFVVLNRATAAVAVAALSGVPLFVHDKNLAARFFLAVSAAAEDMRDFAKDFIVIRSRSQSLSAIDRDRLGRIVVFLESELSYFNSFAGITQTDYQKDITIKRNIERWAENIVNASIDAAKILLASEKKNIPDTYRAVLADLAVLTNFNSTQAEQLARFAKIRNALAHEYLDIRFRILRSFVTEAEQPYRYLLEYIKNIIS